MPWRDAAPAEATEPTAITAETVTVVGPPLRPDQEPEKVTFAHYLRIGNTDFPPGGTAFVSPDYAGQLRRNGYVARG